MAAFSQTPAGTINNSGTIAPIAMPGPPLLTPPVASLPGSGPATGAPPSMDVNNAATGGSGSVYQPSAGTLIGSELPGTPGTVVVTGATPLAAGSANPGTLNVGMGSFVEGTNNVSGASLADIARQYKAQRANAHPRTFDNNNVRHTDYGTVDSNSAALPQSDQPTVYGSTSAPNANGVLDQRDYAAVQAALARGQSQINANASSETVATAIPDPNRSPAPYEMQANNSPVNTPQTQATEPQVRSQSEASSASEGKRLPASASPLPLLFVFGLIACALGGLMYRLRRSEIKL